MAWTTPRTWTTNEIVTAAMLNTDVRDNLNALSAHSHSGAGGDGAGLFVPSWANDQVIAWRFRLPPITVTNATGVQPAVDFIQRAPGTYSTSGLGYDATNKWPFTSWYSVGNVSIETQTGVAMALLPRVDLVWAHVDTTINIRIGLMTPTTDTFITDQPDGVLFSCSGASNWQARSFTGGSTTTVDTGVSWTTAPKAFSIRPLSATRVQFFIDNVLVADITTNIPAAGTGLVAGFGLNGGSGASARSSNYFGLQYRVKSS